MSEQPTVFIVDDDEGVRGAVVWALRKEGLSVSPSHRPKALPGDRFRPLPGRSAVCVWVCAW